ncbi:MAG TPA: hypothetical protein VNH19_11510, partial [Candidatus Limnocylindrales bacterium]|nr:hypothetical protein [Candidatus Limnocylindrales bacterium]
AGGAWSAGFGGAPATALIKGGCPAFAVPLFVEALGPDLHPSATAATTANTIARVNPNASICSPLLFSSANLRLP